MSIHTGTLLRPRLRRSNLRNLLLSPFLIGSLPGWHCSGGGAVGFGVSPKGAYEDWQRRLCQPFTTGHYFLTADPEYWQTAEHQDPTKWGH